MAQFPALPLWTDALIGDTYQLTPAQFGAYLRLLIVQWRSKGCKLPVDDTYLGRAIGDPKNWHRLKPVVMAFFTLQYDSELSGGQCYRQLRLVDEHEYVSRQAAKSSAGGRSKALKSRHVRPAPALPNACLNSAPTPTPTPTHKKKVSKTTAPNGAERGSRIPFETGAVIPPAYRLAGQQLGASLAQINQWWPEFTDYWGALPGQRGRKLDWLKTWRNRVRDQISRDKRWTSSRKPDLKERLSDALQRLGSGPVGEIVDFGLPQLAAK
jgi:uncharacterized protein YdaU (DUF1376 family)